jgi:hypothetical protein
MKRPLLEVIFDLAKTFDAVILYDTEKRLLYFTLFIGNWIKDIGYK